MGQNTANVRVTASPPAFPPDPDAPPILGVCLSGGGSRALTGALGALSGLRSLADPADPSRTVMDRVDYLSSVSGGSWASTAYTFLPDAIDDDTFLITPVPPEQLTTSGPSSAAANINEIDEHCLGSAPQRFSPVPIVRVLFKYFKWGMFTRPERLSWFWPAAIGELILRPFGLYQASYRRSSDVPLPDKTFSSSATEVDLHITPTNPDLTPDDFHLVRAGRPSLIVNFNLLENENVAEPVQVPMQATPTDVGALGRWPDQHGGGADRRGGSVQPFGFGTRLIGPGASPARASVTRTREYCLADIAGCSSAFYAEDILGFLTKETDKVEDAIDEELQRFHIPGFIRSWIRRWSMRKLQPIIHADPIALIPRYPFWRVGAVDEHPPVTQERGFSDGGSFDDTGVLGLLARSDANRVIAFVNGAAALTKHGDEIVVDGQLATLFGRHFDAAAGRYIEYPPTDPRRFAQVFDECDFDALRDGLWAASTGGGSDSDVGTYTTALKQEVVTIDNDVAHIAAGRRITVLWMVNNHVDAWQQAITDPVIRKDLERGQAGQDATPEHHGRDRGPLANFPLYSTGPQIYLHPAAVNMLAQLTAWNVQQRADDIVAMLAD